MGRVQTRAPVMDGMIRFEKTVARRVVLTSTAFFTPSPCWMGSSVGRVFSSRCRVSQSPLQISGSVATGGSSVATANLWYNGSSVGRENSESRISWLMEAQRRSPIWIDGILTSGGENLINFSIL